MPPKDTFLRIQHDWHNKKCKRVFMIHYFKNTESYEDKASNTKKLSDSKLESPPISLHSPSINWKVYNTLSPWKNAWFPEFVHSHVLRDSMKRQATTKQFQKTKFDLNLILLITFKNMAYIQTHPTWDLSWKALRLDETKLPPPCIDTSCLKNIQKWQIIHHTVLQTLLPLKVG